MKFSFFKSAQSKDKKPNGTLDIAQLIDHIRSGTWKKEILAVRAREGSKAYKLLKAKLPCFTGSAILTSRDVSTPVEKRLKDHSGVIFIDVDAKDNPRLRVKDLVDKDCLAQFISPGGKGLKIAYLCSQVNTAAEHRRIFDAVVERLKAKGITIKVDPVVKSIASLQFVSYDPEAYYNPKTKLKIKPLPPLKIQRQYVSEGNEQLKQLDEYIQALGKKDITGLYDDWLNVLFGLAYSFGEAGRSRLHTICSRYPGYSEAECDEKFDSCLESSTSTATPVTVSTVFQLINASLPVAKRRELGKRYQQIHAKGKANEAEAITDVPDLAGFVRYGLWLFKKVVDKKTNEIVELQLARLNLNAFEKLLRDLGFMRYQRSSGKELYVRITDNIVSLVDASDVVRIVTTCIENQGDVSFTYNEIEYSFSWEDLALKWRDLRDKGGIASQISASLLWWEPNLLTDTTTESYIPYRNGIVVVNAKEIKLIPYASIPKQIWVDQILPREFKLSKTEGMFAHFWRNVFGEGKTLKEKLASESYKRAVWYYGYVLQDIKDEALARAWILYDRETGNNGRTGKTIAAKAAGYIRPLEIIDGQKVDLMDRFAFQTVSPATKIVLIDDVKRGESLNTIFAAITGTTTVDKKNVNPVKVTAKYILTSNWILAAEGSSESGRQFVSQAGNFYKDFATNNGDSLTPIRDMHGKTFFAGWNARDWEQFDTFSLKALQFYYASPAPSGTIIGNSRVLRFIQLNEEEVFFSLAVAVINNAYEVNGETHVSVSTMVEAVRDNNDGLSGQKAGRIVRAFFAAIGADFRGMANTSSGPTGKRNVYRLGRLVAQFDFGHYANRLGGGPIAAKKGRN